jgi:glutamate racemase
MKIGFFDSGLGGLTILKAVAEMLPSYDYEYYGDTANLPYGDKGEQEIFELTKRGVEYLFEKNCSIVIIACNTASAETLSNLQRNFLVDEHQDKKILGVIIPTIEEVLSQSPKQITVLGTTRTIESKKYELEFLKLKTDLDIRGIATPTLVPLIEDNKPDEAFKTICKIIDTQSITGAVILGCTHYTILKTELDNAYKGSGVHFFSQDEIIPNKLKLYLSNHPEIKNKLNTTGKKNIFLTKHTDRYDALLQELLGGRFIQH